MGRVRYLFRAQSAGTWTFYDLFSLLTYPGACCFGSPDLSCSYFSSKEGWKSKEIYPTISILPCHGCDAIIQLASFSFSFAISHLTNQSYFRLMGVCHVKRSHFGSHECCTSLEYLGPLYNWLDWGHSWVYARLNLFRQAILSKVYQETDRYWIFEVKLLNENLGVELWPLKMRHIKETNELALWE